MSNKAFTLIELLVVISIIGVLSSIVLVSFSGSRDKARLAKAQNFDAQISHALGAYAVGIWRFEEGGGTTAYDESGYGNDGTFGDGTCTEGNGSCPSWTDGVYQGTNALYFNGQDDYVNVPNSPSLNPTNAITIEVWAKSKAPTTFCRMLVAKGSSYWIEAWNPADKTFQGHVYIDGKVKATPHVSYTIDKWEHWAFTYSASSRTLILYKNGVNSGQTVLSGLSTYLISTSTNNLTISAWGHFEGSIDDVRIYNHALSSAQIQQRYAAGAPSHGIAIK